MAGSEAGSRGRAGGRTVPAGRADGGGRPSPAHVPDPSSQAFPGGGQASESAIGPGTVGPGAPVHRPWGSYQVLDAGAGFQVKRLTVAPGATLSLQRHRHRAEHWVVVRGEAEVTRDASVFRLAVRGSADIPLGAVHRLHNPGPEPLEIVEVQTGAYLGEDDIERLEDDYGRAAPARAVAE